MGVLIYLSSKLIILCSTGADWKEMKVTPGLWREATMLQCAWAMVETTPNS